jgi:hypothetical protein
MAGQRTQVGQVLSHQYPLSQQYVADRPVEPSLALTGGGSNHMGSVPSNQAAVSVTATKAISPVPGVAGYRGAVNQFSKSVVREIRTLRSVGAGGGQPSLATRWVMGKHDFYSDLWLFTDLLSSLPSTGRTAHPARPCVLRRRIGRRPWPLSPYRRPPRTGPRRRRWRRRP